jgi:hypothetical protein
MLWLDRYGRTIEEIMLGDGRNLNRELVRAGFAWWYRKYSTSRLAISKMRQGLQSKVCGQIQTPFRRGSGGSGSSRTAEGWTHGHATVGGGRCRSMQIG